MAGKNDTIDSPKQAESAAATDGRNTDARRLGKVSLSELLSNSQQLHSAHAVFKTGLANL